VKGWLPFAAGMVAVVLGALWTLQGMGVVAGSVMSGETVWTIIGPIVCLIGVVLIVIAMRARRPRP
jgi:predicted anti-sigma-YlaC factor YlaD